MRTLSVTSISANEPDDFDGVVVDGIDSLAQRITQAIRFRAATWFLDRRRGVPYRRLLGHQTTTALAASTITSAIREEGGVEVTGIHDVEIQYDSANREFRYYARVSTTYGDMSVAENITS